MSNSLQRLIDALREELKEYGELLALLDQQQEQVVLRAVEELVRTVAAIQNQGSVIQGARQHREECRRSLAAELSVDADISFARLLPLLPGNVRPLVQALVEENNELLLRVRRRACQNHLVLSRSLELMQRFLMTLLPPTQTMVYDERGGLSMPPLASGRLRDAVG